MKMQTDEIRGTPLPLERTRQDNWAAIGLFVLVLILGCWQMIPGVCGAFHDDGVYVSTAKALAQGDGYRLISLPDSPPQTKYPILYPALLALIWKLIPAFPDNLVIMQGFTLVVGALALALAYLYLVLNGYFSRGGAFAACLLVSCSPGFLYICSIAMSEAPFTLSIVIALWALESHIRQGNSKCLSGILLGVALSLPFLFRIIGIVLVPIALVLSFRAGRSTRWVAFGALLAIVPWVLWIRIMTIGSQDPIGVYNTSYLGWWKTIGATQVFRQILDNLFMMTAGTSSACITLFGRAPQWSLMATFFLGFATLALVVARATAMSVLPCFLTGYLAVVLIWPWPPYRFLVPILPFLQAYVVEVLLTLFQKFPWLRTRKWLVLVCWFVLIAGNISTVQKFAEAFVEFGYPNDISQVTPPVRWSAFEDTFSWLQTHTKPTDVLAAELDTMMFLYTSRRSVRSFAFRPGPMFYGEAGPSFRLDELLGILEKYQVSYLITTPLSGSPEEKPFATLLQELQQKHPDYLRLVYVGIDPRFRIFQCQAVKQESE